MEKLTQINRLKDCKEIKLETTLHLKEEDYNNFMELYDSVDNIDILGTDNNINCDDEPWLIKSFSHTCLKYNNLFDSVLFNDNLITHAISGNQILLLGTKRGVLVYKKLKSIRDF